MKTQRLLLSLLCLLFFAATDYAQPEEPQNEDEWIIRSPIGQETHKAGMKQMIHSFWNGQSAGMMVAMALGNSEVRTAWDVSEEQYQQFRNTMSYVYSPENPEAAEAIKEMGEMMAEMRAFQASESYLMENPDEETIQKFIDLQEKVMSSSEIINAFSISAVADVVENLLTPEQAQKVQETLLASMGEMPMFSPSIFEALNLTDAQRQEMGKIKEELEAEFENTLDDFVNTQLVLLRKVFDEYDKQEERKGFSREEQRALAKKLMAEDPEYKKIHETINSQRKTFVTQFKTRMFDVLTDEQWKRLQELTDNPPEHTKAFLKALRKSLGLGESETEKTDAGWQLGAGSWQPGDAIPETYRQERNTRGNFPRPEN